MKHGILVRDSSPVAHLTTGCFPYWRDLVPVEGRAVDTDRPTASSAVFLVPVKILEE